MRKRTIIATAVAATAATAVAATSTVVAQAQETGDAALTDAIDAILTDPRLADSDTGVVIADADTGEVIYDHNGDKRSTAGSNNKITVAAAALEILGEDYTFTTDVLATAHPDGGTITGDLYLRGGGDPTLLQADYRDLAAELAAAGVEVIDGDLIGDDTAFTDDRLGTEYGWEDLQYLYANETAALTVASGDDYHAGTVRVFIEPGADEGDPAQIRMVPDNDYVTIVNEATTTASGWVDIGVNRDDHDNIIRVTGTIPTTANYTFGTRSVIDPAALATDVFEHALDDHGITVTGRTRTGQTTPQGTRLLAEHHSMPLAELTSHLLKPSNASHANALFKTLGYETTGQGTWAGGKNATYQGIEKYGVDTGPVRQVDGSGVSRHNLLTPAMLTDLLVGAKDAPWFDTWHDAFPIACQDGTLAGRMCATPAAGNVHAKTGSLTSVSALSGYATDADGRELAFSIVTNDFLWWTVKDIEDQIAATIAAHSQDATETDITAQSNADQIDEPDYSSMNLDENPTTEDLQAAMGDTLADGQTADQLQLECTWTEPTTC